VATSAVVGLAPGVDVMTYDHNFLRFSPMFGF
jgi:hypothetical protein